MQKANLLVFFYIYKQIHTIETFLIQPTRTARESVYFLFAGMENTFLKMKSMLFAHVVEINVQRSEQESLIVCEQSTNGVRAALRSVL